MAGCWGPPLDGPPERAFWVCRSSQGRLGRIAVKVTHAGCQSTVELTSDGEELVSCLVRGQRAAGRCCWDRLRNSWEGLA